MRAGEASGVDVNGVPVASDAASVVNVTGDDVVAFVWTGSTFIGLGAAGGTEALGSGGVAEVGRSDVSTIGWLENACSCAVASLPLPLYALSEKLTVPQQAAIPEPASGLVWLLLGGGSLSLSYCRRRRKTN